MTETISSTAKAWVYQATRKLTAEEVAFSEALLSNFMKEWQTHGTALTTGFEIRYDQFIILYVDESQVKASGCSIDSSVGVIRQIGEKTQIDFLDKSKVAYKADDQINVIDFRTIKEKVAEGAITPKTIIFDNTIQTAGDIVEKWETPAEKSWLSRFFK